MKAIGIVVPAIERMLAQCCCFAESAFIMSGGNWSAPGSGRQFWDFDH